MVKQQYNLYHQMILAPRMLYSRFLSPTSDLRLLEKADLHWTYIGGIERGERNLGLLNIVKVARALKIIVSELMANVR